MGYGDRVARNPFRAGLNDATRLTNVELVEEEGDFYEGPQVNLVFTKDNYDLYGRLRPVDADWERLRYEGGQTRNGKTMKGATDKQKVRFPQFKNWLDKEEAQVGEVLIDLVIQFAGEERVNQTLAKLPEEEDGNQRFRNFATAMIALLPADYAQKEGVVNAGYIYGSKNLTVARNFSAGPIFVPGQLDKVKGEFHPGESYDLKYKPFKTKEASENSQEVDAEEAVDM